MKAKTTAGEYDVPVTYALGDSGDVQGIQLHAGRQRRHAARAGDGQAGAGADAGDDRGERGREPGDGDAERGGERSGDGDGIGGAGESRGGGRLHAVRPTRS